MRFLSVRAGAFGPFRPGEELELAEGMNVIFGANEAGKSSWHAALYAGFCGVRRTGRRFQGEDLEFAERHRPWAMGANGAWSAATTVQMQDGSQIELRHDLASRTAQVSNLPFGTKFEADLMQDGAPDGARLLGLDRGAFLATACVRQADLVEVRRASPVLQQYLQKAVATGHDDATVAGALNSIAEFRNEKVGSNRANSGKPWRAALDASGACEQSLADARAQHERHLALVEQVDASRRRAGEAEDRYRLAQARQAAGDAERIEARAARAADLIRAFPSGRPPASLADDALATRAGDALAAWDACPALLRLEGPSTAELQAQLDALPQPPDGETRPDGAFGDARDRFRDAMRDLQAHRQAEAPERPGAAGPLVSGPTPRVMRPRRSPTLLVVALALIVLGMLLLSLKMLAGESLLGAGAIVALCWWLSGRGRGSLPVQQVGAAEVEALMRRGAWEAWERRRQELEDSQERAARTLVVMLRQKGIEPGGDLLADCGRYEAECRARAADALAAELRPRLEQMLRLRAASEAEELRGRRQRQDATDALLTAATACGISAAAPDGVAEGLRAWRRERAGRLAGQDTQREAWTELQRLLDGRSLEALLAEAGAARKRADSLAFNLPEHALPTPWAEAVSGEEIAALRSEWEDLDRGLAELQGRLQAEAATLSSVPAAVEELSAAQAELGRIERLRRTLELTEQFLRDAQERVHRDVAPVLAKSLSDRLHLITGGRYQQVMVDPRDLNVRVRLANGALQPAHLLSHGTAEQVYLLLRVAIAELLTRQNETCPLVLDDVTVQSDATRTTAMLDALHAISAERQIILFTQEDDVLRWAESRLSKDGKDCLTRLPAPGPVG